jgi:hypothetical protein
MIILDFTAPTRPTETVVEETTLEVEVEDCKCLLLTLELLSDDINIFVLQLHSV